MGKLAIKDAYLMVLICREHRRYLRFYLAGTETTIQVSPIWAGQLQRYSETGGHPVATTDDNLPEHLVDSGDSREAGEAHNNLGQSGGR